MVTLSDQIEKKVILQASLSRVWQAISVPREFGAWFGLAFDEPFVEGKRIFGRIAPTKVDAQIARLQEPHVGKVAELFIERIAPEHLFAFKWHPFAVDPNVDYAMEPMTLITFSLLSTPKGTELTITESGFKRLPMDRRAAAFSANDNGWEAQTKLIKTFVEQYAP